MNAHPACFYHVYKKDRHHVAFGTVHILYISIHSVLNICCSMALRLSVQLCDSHSLFTDSPSVPSCEWSCVGNCSSSNSQEFLPAFIMLTTRRAQALVLLYILPLHRISLVAETP